MSVRSRLDEAEVARFVASHRGWHSERGELRRTYDFSNFKESLRFVNAVAAIAEREQHHPDIGLQVSPSTAAEHEAEHRADDQPVEPRGDLFIHGSS